MAQTRDETLLEIAQFILDGMPGDERAAHQLLKTLLTNDLADAIREDEWGDTNAEAELENIALLVSEELGGALVDVGFGGDVNVAADEFIDQVMIHADDIVDDAWDALSDDADVARTQVSLRGREI